MYILPITRNLLFVISFIGKITTKNCSKWIDSNLPQLFYVAVVIIPNFRNETHSPVQRSQEAQPGRPLILFLQEKVPEQELSLPQEALQGIPSPPESVLLGFRHFEFLLFQESQTLIWIPVSYTHLTLPTIYS